MEKSFQELLSTLSEHLCLESCLEMAEMFGLRAELRDKLMKSSEPGSVFFDEIVNEQLISASNVSSLDVILTRTDNLHLAEHVREYRRRNVTFPTTISKLLC